jgi:hypothetical protein
MMPLQGLVIGGVRVSARWPRADDRLTQEKVAGTEAFTHRLHCEMIAAPQNLEVGISMGGDAEFFF